MTDDSHIDHDSYGASIGSAPRPLQINRVQWVDLERISGDGTFCHRLDLNVEPLARQIELHGQLEPIMVRPVSGGAAYQVISGFRRVAAVTRLGFERVQAIVCRALADEAAMVMSVAGNEHRQPYNDMERARIIARWTEMKLPNAQITEVLGIGVRQKNNLRRLLELPRVAQAAIVEGEHPFTSTHALHLLRIRGGRPELDIEAWVERVRVEGLSVSDLSARLEAVGEGVAALFKRGREPSTGVIEFARRRIDVEALSMAERAELAEQVRQLLAVLEPGEAAARSAAAEVATYARGGSVLDSGYPSAQPAP